MVHNRDYIHFPSFSEATAYARQVARTRKKSIAIVRSGNEWLVRYPWETRVDPRPPENDEPDAHLVLNEIFEDQVWYALSDEDGWFYPDDFEGNPPLPDHDY